MSMDPEDNAVELRDASLFHAVTPAKAEVQKAFKNPGFRLSPK
jgi:hypothetical protein